MTPCTLCLLSPMTAPRPTVVSTFNPKKAVARGPPISAWLICDQSVVIAKQVRPTGGRHRLFREFAQFATLP
jgi:hypothetical protein